MFYKVNPSRSATFLSCSNCFLDISVTVTSAPAAARTGACCPPPDAKQSIFNPSNDFGNQSLGTDFSVVTVISHSPDLLLSITSLLTGCVYLGTNLLQPFYPMHYCFVELYPL